MIRKNGNMKNVLALKMGLTLIALIIFAVLLKSFIIPHIKEERRKVQIKAKAIYLNHHLPTFADLVIFVADRSREHPGALRDYQTYYEKVIDAFPQISEAHSFLGFCYYYLGKEEEAVLAFKKSIMLNPQLFWSHYNLGIIYFKNAQYELAHTSFQKALLITPKKTMQIILQSKIHQQVFGKVTNVNQLVIKDLKLSYSNSSSLASICTKQLSSDPANHLEDDKVAEISRAVQLEIF